MIESQYEAGGGVGGCTPSAANVRCAANPIGGDRTGQDCGSGASRLVPVTRARGRGLRWAQDQKELH
jgi:hypothetical protein